MQRTGGNSTARQCGCLYCFGGRTACQGKGAGSLLIHALEGYIRENLAPGWAVSLELISTREAVSFYRKMGFEERPCAWDGPGMFKMLR